MVISVVGGAAAGSVMRVLISDQTLNGLGSGGGACSAGIKVKRDGQYHAGTNNSSATVTYADVGGREWAERESATIGDIYEVILETSSGSGLTAGTADVWQGITVDREYKVSVASTGFADFIGTLKIRRLGTTTVLDSAAISLSALSVP